MHFSYFQTLQYTNVVKVIDLFYDHTQRAAACDTHQDNFCLNTNYGKILKR